MPKRCCAATLLPTQVKANGLIVFVPKYGIEGPVYLVTRDNNKKGAAAAVDEPQFVLDEEAQAVTSM